MRNRYEFPENVNLKDSEAPSENTKKSIFEKWPETQKEGQNRGFDLVEDMNKRILSECQNGSKQICYLIIGHGIWVNETA